VPLLSDSAEDKGRNALQALLAFACIHQQATQREPKTSGKAGRLSAPKLSPDEFALNEVLELVAQRAVSITGADGVAVALADNDAIVCRASAGEIAPPPGVKLDPNSGFSGACLRSGQTVRCDDSETDGRVNAEACRMLGTRSMIAVPLSAKQRVIGLIEAFSKEEYGFNDSDVRSLNLLGELILAAIRPEEEDRLAEISRNVVVPETTRHTNDAAPALIEPKSARLIIDEKFAPAPAETGAEQLKPEPPVINAISAPPEQFIPGPPEPDENFEANTSAEKIRETFGAATTFLANQTLLGPNELEAPGERPGKQPSVVSIVVIAASVLVAIALGWGVLRAFRHGEQAISASTQRPIEVKTNPGQSAEILPSAAVGKPGATPQVTGIRHLPSATSSIVVIDLEDQVQYEDHTLQNPPRIYIDLHDTKIASGLLNQSIDVDDQFVKKVRMAQPVEGVTRVVLETRGDAGYSLRLDSNPYRLTIDVHKPETVPGNVSTPALPKPSAAITIQPRQGRTSPLASSEFRMVLDAGHGGWDLGTVGRKGLLEKDLVLDIVQRLGKLVQSKLGAQVIYTRQDDSYLPLEKRAEIANMAGADLFLSVHANYSDLATARGVETYYTNTYSSVRARTDGDDPQLKQVDWTGVDIRAKVTDSRRFAADVQQSLYGGLAARNPDIRNRGVKKAEYVVLTGTQMPAVLAEVSFVSSPADEDQLRNADYREGIAEALYRGIAKYRDETKHTKLASVKRN